MKANVHNRRAKDNRDTMIHTDTHTYSNGLTANAFTLQFMSISTLHRNIGTSHHPK